VVHAVMVGALGRCSVLHASERTRTAARQLWRRVGPAHMGAVSWHADRAWGMRNAWGGYGMHSSKIIL
jgi:hypothetical protein